MIKKTTDWKSNDYVVPAQNSRPARIEKKKGKKRKAGAASVGKKKKAKTQ